jgi:predicted N-acyltransferase
MTDSKVMRITEARSIREIDEELWDSVTGNVLSMTHRWLRVTETSWRFHEPRYLLLEDDQGPCAVIATDAYVSLRDLGFFGWLRQRLSLAIRPPFSSMCGVMVRPGMPLNAMVPELDKVLSQLCHRERRLLITVSNVSTYELPAWQQAGFLAYPQKGVSVLDLPSTYDLYQQSLNREARQELRRAHRRGAKFDVHFETGPLANDSEQIQSLVCEVFAKHGISYNAIPFAADFFGQLDREMSGNVQFVRGYAGGELAGLFVCLQNGSTLWAPLAGLRYEIARPSYLYFLLFDEVIRWSIEHGIQKLYMGKTNERQKQRQGFRLEERWLCYRSNFRPLNPVLAFGFPLIQCLLRHS